MYTQTLPMKADLPPSLVMAQATLAGAPPGALRKPVDSAKETPEVSGTKSISISPKETINGVAIFCEKKNPIWDVKTQKLMEAKWEKRENKPLFIKVVDMQQKGM